MALTPAAATGAMARAHKPSVRGERPLLSSSDDRTNIQIQATHTPDGRDFDVRPLMCVVEDALRRAMPITIEVLLFILPISVTYIIALC